MRLKVAVAITAFVLSIVTTSPAQAIDAGTYRVGTEIQPGIYAGNAGTDIGDSCRWQRLSGLSGDFDDIIESDLARGQFYVEVMSTDSYFTVACEITPLAEWPTPPQPLTDIGIGMYIVGRDIAPGIYAGNPGTEVLDSCSWRRLSGATGDFDDIIESDLARGQFYVEVKSTDSYFTVGCDMTTLDNWPTPPQPLTEIVTGMYIVDRDIAPGIYAGNPGTGTLDYCSWDRLSGATGDYDDIIESDLARGQFYVEVMSTDSYFTVGCDMTTLDNWPTPPQPLTEIVTGMYIVDRDIAPGIYAGNPGTGTLDYCSWDRLSGATGDYDDIIESDLARGQFYVEVMSTDSYFTVGCDMTTLDNWPTPPQPLTEIVTGMYIVDRDIAPGIYAGNPGTGTLDYCSWDRLSGATGDYDDIIESDLARGQFYVEVMSTDSYFTVGCDMTTLDNWPTPPQPLTTLELGMYLVDRDISPGTYNGQTGDGILDYCSWQRLSGVSGDYSEVIDSGSATGTYSVVVEDSDFALMTRCTLNLVETTDTGTSTLSVSLTVSGTPLVRLDQPIGLTATFSASVSGVTVSVNNGIASNFVGSDGDSVYTFDVTPNAVGDVVVNVFHVDTSGVLSLGIPYDDDHDGVISGPEVLSGVRDYFLGNLTGQQVLELVRLYFSGAG